MSKAIFRVNVRTRPGTDDPLPPNGDKPSPDYRCGLLVVVVRGIPQLGTIPLTAAEVEAEDVVQDNLDDAA